MNAELAEGWVRTTLGAVVESMKNGLYKPVQAYADSGIACLRMYNIDEGKIVWKDIKRMRLSKAEIADYELLPGDILVNRVNSRELVGKAAVIPEGLERCVFESKNIRVRLCRGAIVPEFASYALLLAGRHYFTRNAQQVVGMASVNQPQLHAFPLALAPLPEQRRIIAELERTLTRVDASRERLQRIVVILTRFRQSVLAAACSGRLTADWRESRGIFMDEAWRYDTLAGICTAITDGDHQPPPQQPSGIPFLTIGNVSSGELDFSRTRFVSEHYFAELKPERRPERDDVLYTVVATIGIAVLVDVDRPFCFQRHIALLRASEATIPAFLRILLASPAVVHEARLRATGTAQPTLSLSSLRSIPVSLPSIAEQQEIVQRVEALLALADRLQARYAQAKTQVEKVTPSLLAKAFRAELVPTEAELARIEGRDYESASALLERIRVDDVALGKESTSEASRGARPSIARRRKV